MPVSDRISVTIVTCPNHPAYNRKEVGHCVVATKNIAKNAHIGIYAGVLRQNTEKAEWNPYQNAPTKNCSHYIDAESIGNQMRFINDYRNIASAPNVGFFINPLRVNGYLVSVVVALRTIAKGEELLLDYGDKYWAEYSSWQTESCETVTTDEHSSSTSVFISTPPPLKRHKNNRQ
jgi:SET domain-containing protein